MINIKTVGATLLAGAALCSATSAKADTISYLFDGVTDSGSLIGETYGGSFSFDDAGLALSGFESVPLQALSFHFLETGFGLGDAVAATADFQDGVFLGLSYTVEAFDPSFSLVSGLFDSGDAYFAYTPAGGIAGFGSVSYSVVPLPAGLALLPTGLAVLAGVRRRRPALA